MVKRLSNTDQNSQKISNVPTPVNPGDAVNKEYVDLNSGSGDVIGPEESQDGSVALFDGASGKLLKTDDISFESATKTLSTEALKTNRIVRNSYDRVGIEGIEVKGTRILPNFTYESILKLGPDPVEYPYSGRVQIDGLLIDLVPYNTYGSVRVISNKDYPVLANGIKEYTPDKGVLIEDSLLKDGQITVASDPVQDMEVATKAYVDNNSSSYDEITEAEITAGTASTARAISGRRAQEIVNKAVAAAPVVTVNATAPTSPKIGDIWVEV